MPRTAPGPGLARRIGLDRLAARVDVVTDPRRRRLLTVEVVVVLVVTFGLSGLYSVLDLAGSLLAPEPLGDQTTTLNGSRSSLGWLDLAYQLAGTLRLLGWAALPLVLLAHSGIGPRALGFVRERAGRQVAAGLALTALIGVPGLAVYLGSVALGLNLQVQASGLQHVWWGTPVLVLRAFANGAAEEVLVVGYLLVRLRQLGWSPWASLAASALLRGSYHLYQGFGGGVGNLLMGLVFAAWWMRTRRLGPLVLAHTLLDVVAFVGYAALAGHVSWL